MRKAYAQKYDEFQREAVGDICEDFSEKANGRYLLVIPTGGGKTITAVKSINSLFDKGVLDKNNDRVMWVAHRDYLIGQAEGSFNKFEQWFPDQNSYKSQLDFCMISKASAQLAANPNIKLVVIDEAHHAAANTYLPLFDPEHVGVLGLTATPTRHDGKPLEFERESYSIGFPDLVDRGVVLRPEVRTVNTNITFSDIAGFSDEDLDKLDDAKRNQKIIDAILKNHEDYDKVVIYVGTKKHAENLAKAIKESKLGELYESVAFITGEKNSHGLSRKHFLEKEKQFKRSIIVNVDVLTEGYDDPSVNTIVMARPTRSKLVYMQAMGRAIRHDPNNDAKTAYVIEIEDTLPNIRYRIDNRWLYAEISDALEPAVEDREYADVNGLNELLKEIYEQYGVTNPEDRVLVENETRNRYSLLFFKVYTGAGSYRHIPILISKENRTKISNFFNYLSARIPYLVQKQINSGETMKSVDTSGSPILLDSKNQTRILEAMENSISSDPEFSESKPWITFFSFRHRKPEDQLPPEIIEFLEGMVNADRVKEEILGAAYPNGSILVRFPLPLGAYLGRIVPVEEFNEIENVIKRLVAVKKERLESDHRAECQSILFESRIPVEASLANSLSLIVRDEIKYNIELP